MSLSACEVRPSIAVSDMARAADFYEGTLGLSAGEEQSDESRIYACGGGTSLHVYASPTRPVKATATLATWYAVDLDQVVDELRSRGVHVRAVRRPVARDRRQGHPPAHRWPGGLVQGSRREHLRDRGGSAIYVLSQDQLPSGSFSHEFVGDDHGGVGVSVILTDAGPDQGPSLHTHPYTEIHIVQAGEALFFTDDEQRVVRAGEIVVVPAGVPHGFRSQGAFREIAIHDNGHFVTEWLPTDA